MSQSKTSYGAEGRKGTARPRRAQHDNQTEKSSDSETIEPACRAGEIGRLTERREWREMPYNSRTRAFYGACEWCYPDGAPDESETENVVRSCRKPTSYHRPRDGSEPEHDTDAPESDTDGNRISQISIELIGVISSLTDLEKGQQVIWKNRERPLRVTETASGPDGTITLRGPDGGEYQVEERSELPRPYYLFGTGYLTEITRVRVAIQAEAV